MELSKVSFTDYRFNEETGISGMTGFGSSDYMPVWRTVYSDGGSNWFGMKRDRVCKADEIILVSLRLEPDV